MVRLAGVTRLDLVQPSIKVDLGGIQLHAVVVSLIAAVVLDQLFVGGTWEWHSCLSLIEMSESVLIVSAFEERLVVVELVVVVTACIVSSQEDDVVSVRLRLPFTVVSRRVGVAA